MLVEAADALGMAEDERTWTVARRLVDHALDWGWDEEHGGFYDKGESFAGTPSTPPRSGGPRPRASTPCMVMDTKYGKRDRPLRQGVPQAVGLHPNAHARPASTAAGFRKPCAMAPCDGDGAKASPWKANYHRRGR